VKTAASPPNGQDDLELPELTFALACELGEFPEFPIRYTEQDLDIYRSTTGDATAGEDGIVPPAFAAIFGRQGYLRRHRMPGGGVLLGQDIEWLRPALLSEDLLVSSRVADATELPDGRRSIVFVTIARQAGHDVARVRIKAGWPR
jgi:hypothetical protein